MICIDASVAVKWVFPEEHSAQAIALAAMSDRTGERMVGPTLLPIELTNTIRRRMLRFAFSLAEGIEVLSQFHAFGVTIMSPAGLSERALALADRYQLPAVYDAHYIALAQLLGCVLWTNDQRLLRALGGKMPFVKWIGDYPHE